MIPIPVVGLIPFAICILAETALLCLIWWMPPNEFDIPKAASSKKVATGSISNNGTGGSVVTSVTVQSSDSIAVPMQFNNF